MARYKLPKNQNNSFDSSTANPTFTDDSTIIGGDKVDNIFFNGNNINVNGESGSDIIEGNGRNNVFDGDAGNDSISGGDNDDSVRGGSGRDTLYGNDGNDLIQGDSGDDFITGGDDGGDDDIGFSGSTLTAFSPGDTLKGGGGHDTFVFAGDEDDHDLITDFNNRKDKLLITGVSDIQQISIDNGVLGKGLLIITDGPDDGIFLSGVKDFLEEGKNFILTD